MLKITDYKIPEELQNRLDKDQTLKKAFTGLTQGRQRVIYSLFFPSQTIKNT
jgi:uncharacterized protein YdeI (YjbR/CyaY-like superfamily)